MDGQTEFSSQYRVCITCSAVKIVLDVLSDFLVLIRQTDAGSDSDSIPALLIRFLDYGAL